MSATISGIASNSDIQSMMTQMFNRMNKADSDGLTGLSKAELSSIDTSNDNGGAAFIKSLQEQFDNLDSNSDGQLSDKEMKNAKPTQDKLGMPAGMEISEAGTEETDPYQELLNSLMNSLVSSLDSDGDGKISQEELQSGAKKIQEKLSSPTTATTETAGSTANSELGDNLKNMASNFIQKLIDSYKDKGSVLGISASSLSSII